MRMFTNKKNREEDRRDNLELLHSVKGASNVFVEGVRKLLAIPDEELKARAQRNNSNNKKQ